MSSFQAVVEPSFLLKVGGAELSAHVAGISVSLWVQHVCKECFVFHLWLVSHCEASADSGLPVRVGTGNLR